MSEDKPDRTTVVSEEAAPSGTVADRQQDRFTVDVSVTANSDHYFLAGAATDLSAGGVFIATAILHPVGTEFDISMHIDDGEKGVVRAVGVVRWHRSADEDDAPQGVGLQFVEVESDGAARIERHIARCIERAREQDTDEPDSSARRPHWTMKGRTKGAMSGCWGSAKASLSISRIAAQKRRQSRSTHDSSWARTGEPAL